MSDDQTDSIKRVVDDLILNSPTPNWHTSTVNGEEYHLINNDLSDIIPTYEEVIGSKLNPKNAWTVYGEEGTYHTIHRHHETPDFLCTVLFLETIGVSSPNGDFYAVLNNGVYQFSPTKGDLLVFSSDVCHGTYPQVKGLRHTLNIDFDI